MIADNNIRLGDKKEEKLSWADIQYYSLTKIFNSRHQGDTGAYRSGVNALELILTGHADDYYKRDLQLLNNKLDIIREEEGSEQADVIYYDEKLKALSELLYRINKGIQRVRQRLKDSTFSRENAKKLINGTGQNMFITGAPGSGKSYTAMALALELTKYTGRKFTMKHVVFTPQEFLKVYNDETLTPSGSVIIYDEAGVTYNSKDHAKEGNKLFSKLLQTIRHRAVCVIFTAPDLSYMDKDGRKLLHWWLETTKVNKSEGICTLRPYTVKVDQRTGNILYPYAIYEENQLTRLDVELIPKRIATTYEKKAKKYKDDLALSTELKYGMMEDSQVKRLKEFIKYRSKGKNITETCEAMGINKNTGTKLERMRHSTLGSHFS